MVYLFCKTGLSTVYIKNVVLLKFHSNSHPGPG
jgi:hypothetical protein